MNASDWHGRLNCLDCLDKVYIIGGATASGKTAYGIKKAIACDGEIVSADSMQIYRSMNIGTAKPDLDERQGIVHHMIDIVEPDQDFSVAQYQEMALKTIRDILFRGKTPIVVGGTGLYINALLYNIRYAMISENPEFRERMTELSVTNGTQWLHLQLERIDPTAALKIHSNDVKRTIRALEIFHETGITATEQIAESRRIPPPFSFEIVGLDIERELLYDRINRRVDQMIQQGLVEEVASLLHSGWRNGTAMQAIGYKEMTEHLDGRETLDEAVERIKKNTRNYAKRQLTWFRRIEELRWIRP